MVAGQARAAPGAGEAAVAAVPMPRARIITRARQIWATTAVSLDNPPFLPHRLKYAVARLEMTMLYPVLFKQLESFRWDMD